MTKVGGLVGDRILAVLYYLAQASGDWTIRATNEVLQKKFYGVRSELGLRYDSEVAGMQRSIVLDLVLGELRQLGLIERVSRSEPELLTISEAGQTKVQGFPAVLAAAIEPIAEKLFQVADRGQRG